MFEVKFRGFCQNNVNNPYQKAIGTETAIINGKKVTGRWIESNGIYYSVDRKGVFLDGMKPGVANNWMKIVPETLEYHVTEYTTQRPVIFKGFVEDKNGRDKYKGLDGQIYKGKWIYGNSIHYPRNPSNDGKCFITDYKDKSNKEYEIVWQSLCLLPADPNKWEYTPMCAMCCPYVEIMQEEYDEDPLVMCGKCDSRLVGMLDDIRENDCPCIAYEDDGKNIDPDYIL